MQTYKMSSNKNKMIEPVQCKICNITVKRRNLKQHLQIHKEGRFLCDICGVYKAKRKDSLEAHKKLVHNVGEESINDCLFCQKKLVSIRDTEIHLRSHTMERPYFCKFCPYECTTAQYYKTHTRRIHSLKRKPVFHCATCSKKFFDKECLKHHLKIHLVPPENLPFKCDVCFKPFRNRSHLNSHKRVHSKEKPFPCRICNLAFTQEAHLTVHIRIHTGEKPYGCKVCKKRFATSSALAVHMRTHSGEKPYACAVCKNGFAQRTHLKSHMRMHSVKNPYSCKECNVAYADRRSLQAQTKRFHL